MSVLIYKDGILDFASPEEMRHLKANAKVNSVLLPEAGQRLMGFFCKDCNERLDIDDLYVHKCSLESPSMDL